MHPQVAEPVCISDAAASNPHQWLQHVIVLLDSAVHQIDSRYESARSALVSANSLLRRQLNRAPPEAMVDQRQQLPPSQACKVQHYIDEHISEPLSVAALGALIGLGESHFSRSFRRTFGRAPYAFVIQRRIELAIQFMLETKLPLCDIALRCGFVDQPHLSKLFRRATGHTPAAWRREFSGATDYVGTPAGLNS